MTHVLDVVKLGTYVHLQSFICQTAHSGNGLGCADDNSPNIQERSEWKSFTLRFEAEAERATSPPTVTMDFD
jgi:hypothetical protein